MMTLQNVMEELKSYGDESVKRLWLKHGIKEPFFGVKIQHLKLIQKKTGLSYPLAKELFSTGNADAMYLAALITDDNQMSRDDLNSWVNMAFSSNINQYAVPWVAAGSKFGMERSLEWITSQQQHIAVAGWATLSNIAALKPDNEVETAIFCNLLEQTPITIAGAPPRVQLAINSFIISVGCYIKVLTNQALQTAKQIGILTIDMNGTACKVPNATAYINKVKEKGTIGKKKKTVKC
jgi:3-methyladenine DNA glycosylase AlkD